MVFTTIGLAVFNAAYATAVPLAKLGAFVGTLEKKSKCHWYDGIAGTICYENPEHDQNTYRQENWEAYWASHKDVTKEYPTQARSGESGLPEHGDAPDTVVVTTYTESPNRPLAGRGIWDEVTDPAELGGAPGRVETFHTDNRKRGIWDEVTDPAELGGAPGRVETFHTDNRKRGFEAGNNGWITDDVEGTLVDDQPLDERYFDWMESVSTSDHDGHIKFDHTGPPYDRALYARSLYEWSSDEEGAEIDVQALQALQKRKYKIFGDTGYNESDDEYKALEEKYKHYIPEMSSSDEEEAIKEAAVEDAKKKNPKVFASSSSDSDEVWKRGHDWAERDEGYGWTTDEDGPKIDGQGLNERDHGYLLFPARDDQDDSKLPHKPMTKRQRNYYNILEDEDFPPKPKPENFQTTNTEFDFVEKPEFTGCQPRDVLCIMGLPAPKHRTNQEWDSDDMEAFDTLQDRFGWISWVHPEQWERIKWGNAGQSWKGQEDLDKYEQIKAASPHN